MEWWSNGKNPTLQHSNTPSLMKKREAIARLIQQHRHLFQCPLCKDPMWMHDASLVCANKHTFDLSRRGYLNLLLRPPHTRYDTAMLASRRELCRIGFFTPMLEAVSQCMLQEIVTTRQSTVLDAGCGEGSHLTQIIDDLQKASPHGIQGVGVDISKDGIRIAVRDSWHIIWCVADLSRLPFQNRQFDSIVNILSPANYGEFERVLTNEGILIKVVPGNRHLAELRTMFFDAKSHAPDSHERVIRYFSRHFTTIATHHLTYSVTVPREFMKHVIDMTPLSWNVTAEKRQQMLNVGSAAMTVDVHILVGKKSNSG
jgi:23S rRNA (guanine745-N1)-methyltransferase